jgi:hypothetical protein
MPAPVPPPPWVNWTALWQIVVLGLIAGAGLPALFAVGLRALAIRGGTIRGGGRAQPAGAGQDSGQAGIGLAGTSAVGLLVAGLCFLIVLAAIGWGIYAIYQAGHPAAK